MKAKAICLALLGATLLYMAGSFGSFPDQVPMQWDADNNPTWHASRGFFFVWYIVGMAFLTSLFVLILPRKAPSIVWMGVLMNAVGLFLFHVIFQQVNSSPFLFVPVDIATYIVLAVCFPVTFVVVYQAKREHRSRKKR